MKNRKRKEKEGFKNKREKRREGRNKYRRNVKKADQRKKSKDIK